MSDVIPPTPAVTADFAVLDGLYQIELSPITIRGIFLLLTRLHYSTPDNYGNLREQLRRFVWSKNQKETALLIELDYEYNPKPADASGQRPAIYVGTNDYVFAQAVINSLMDRTDNRAGTNFTSNVKVEVILRHVGKTPDEALALSTLSKKFYQGIRTLLQEKLRVKTFDIARIATSRPFERTSVQPDQQFMSDLVMNLVYEDSWTTIREGHILKTVGMETFKTICMDDNKTPDLPGT
jgi:hypothetical protein